jgi:hypothetical protein
MPAPIVPIGVALARLIAKHGLPAVQKAMTSTRKGNAARQAAVDSAKKKHPSGKGLPNQGAKAKVLDIKTGAEVKNPKPVPRKVAKKAPAKKAVKPPQKPLNLTTRGKATAVVGTGAAAVGTTKVMKKAGEKNAERLRKTKSKSVPVPRNPRKQ